MKRDAKHPWKRIGRCLAAGLLALGLSASLVPGAAAAENLPAWARSSAGPKASLQEALPESFDLRDRGVVTPVKDQSPWGSCWAFGGIAAAETSILTYLGQTWEEAKLDLSEKHLAWFAIHPVTEAEAGPEQAGEGLHLVDEAKQGTNAVYDTGGNPVYVTTLFSSGVGPLMEEGFPYRGSEGLTVADVMEQNGKDEATVMKMRAMDEFSAEDDWTIPELDNGYPNRNLYAGFTLRDGNILPLLLKYDEDMKYAGPNEAGMRAVKEELMAGRGVNIGFHSDNAMPGDQMEPKYINTDTWAHYTYDDLGTNHTVCIVGWDDNYPKERFLSGHQPPEDGAWIVKNSWGSEDPKGIIELSNGSSVGKYNWGFLEEDEDGNVYHTGYFYLSYYDRSMTREPETLTFTDDLAGTRFFPMQYDYMPALDGFWQRYSTKDKLMATANVFTADENMLLTSVSTRTVYAGSTATLSVYLLDKPGEDADPADLNQQLANMDSKEPAAQLVDVEFPYAGYHRVDLTDPLPIEKGQRFAVVSCVLYSWTDQDGNLQSRYCLSANRGRDREDAIKDGSRVYCTARVNPGESWIYLTGDWYDLSDIKTEDWFLTDNKGYEVDNFSIKAFGVPWEAPDIQEPVMEDGVVTATFTSGPGKATAVCSYYNEEGQMRDSASFSFAGEKDLYFTLEEVRAGEPGFVKLFLLDENGRPLCENKTIDLTRADAR